ncbi:hypothetical protein Syun_012573 [Stephania yunnanensis]|uniref:DUF7610 domain-containing protein n=1 Tax=Stephania yunnanensis TaxID=152371 RepID=A0AAP0JZN0_9MAGN
MEKLPFAVLQKKLEELESSIREVVELPLETFCHDLEAESIKNRFGFLKTLLTAETESYPHVPEDLQFITQKVSELEKVFQEWDSLRTSPMLMLPPPLVDHNDTSSSCSCTHGDDESSPNSNQYTEFSDTGITDCPSYEEPKQVSQEAIGENSTTLMLISKVEEKTIMETRNRSSKTSLIIFMIALVSLSVVIITRHSDIHCYHEGEMNFFPTPT